MSPRDQTQNLEDPTEPILLGPGVELPADLAARVKAELEPGESLLWASQAVCPMPKPGQYSTEEGPNVSAFVIWTLGLWTLAAITGLASLGQFGWISDEAETYLIMASLTLVTIGAMLAGSLVVHGFKAGFGALMRKGERLRPIYALSDRRAIIWVPQSRLSAFQVIHQPARSLSGVHRIELPDSTGDVIFESGQSHWSPGGLKGVSDVRRVEALARSVLVDPEYRKRRPVEDGF